MEFYRLPVVDFRAESPLDRIGIGIIASLESWMRLASRIDRSHMKMLAHSRLRLPIR